MTRRHPLLPRVDFSLPAFLSQATARSNAAEACALLRERRTERDDVDAYLRSRRPPAGT